LDKPPGQCANTTSATTAKTRRARRKAFQRENAKEATPLTKLIPFDERVVSGSRDPAAAALSLKGVVLAAIPRDIPSFKGTVSWTRIFSPLSGEKLPAEGQIDGGRGMASPGRVPETRGKACPSAKLEGKWA
jgi:hypothetical protein